MPHAARLTRPLLAFVLAAALGSGGCASADEPVRDSREALGTVVAITAYGKSAADMRHAVDDAYVAMTQVEAELDAHDPDSAIARVNASAAPEFERLPPHAEEVLDTICALEVREWFSPQLWATTELWDFEHAGHVPTDGELTAALADLRYDFGGAEKGVALDEAMRTLGASGAVAGALISSGSTTLAFGEKPGKEPWRIGVEDPRKTDSVIATIEAEGDIAVSTSGDYQRFFERDGVRYHHILDPATGRPVRGLRSLTVIGDISGRESDILSTALFVAGDSAATTYVRARGLGLVLVDEEGRTHIVPGPEGASWQVKPH